jgi:hypothetical protein
MVVYELDDSVLVGVATLADLTGIVSRRSMDFDDAVINLPWRSFVQAFVVGLRLGLEQCTHLLVGTTHRGFAPKTKIPERGHEMVPTTDAVWLAAQGSMPHGQVVAEAERIAKQVSAFHWPLMFADIMGRGGFDVVLGNPPWERIKLQEQEFFAARDPEIANASNKAARSKLIKALAEAKANSPERRLYEEFALASRAAEAASQFARDGARFPLTGRGDVNTYALFAELFANLANGQGRAGVIVPTGIATDATTAPFFASLIKSKRLARLVDFENRERIFPSVYFRVKFCLLTIGRNEPSAGFAFFLTNPAQLANAERNFVLSPESIAAINPNTKTAAIFRARADAELTAKIYARVPVLIHGEGAAVNPWGISFMATADSYRLGGGKAPLMDNQGAQSEKPPACDRGLSVHFRPNTHVAAFSRSMMSNEATHNASAVPATIRMYVMEHLPP